MVHQIWQQLGYSRAPPLPLPFPQQAFARGLFNTCKSTRTLIITGGASSGVSALVAGAFTKSHHPPPIVGFMPWGKVLGNLCLKDNHGESKPRNYLAGASNSAAGWCGGGVTDDMMARVVT